MTEHARATAEEQLREKAKRWSANADQATRLARSANAGLGSVKPEADSATALASIALSLSVIAEVLTETVSDEASR